MSTSANPEVNHWRWIDDTSGAAHEAWPFAAAEDTNITGALDVGFALVFKIANLGDMQASQAFSLQYNVDGAGWNMVSNIGPSDNVRPVNSGDADRAGSTTERLTTSGRNFWGSSLDEVNGVIGENFSGTEDAEYYYSIEFLSADLLAGGEVIEFRLLYGNDPNQATFTHNVGPITATMPVISQDDISELPSQALTLTAFAPNVRGDYDPNHISELPSQAIILDNTPTDFTDTFRPRGPVTVYGENGEIAYIDSDWLNHGGGADITVDPTTFDNGGAFIQEGDLIVIHINAQSVGAQTVSDDNGSTPFTNQFRSEDPGSSTCEYTIWTRIIGASEPATYSFLKTNTTPSHEAMVRVYRNVDSTIFDVAPIIGNADFGLDTTQINDLTAPGITTAIADSMAVAWVQNDRQTGDENGGLTYTAGWNLGRSVATNSINLSVSFEKPMASAGATGNFVVTSTNTVTNTWLAVQYALKKAAPGEISQIGTDALTLAPFAPQIVTTEKHISLLATVALALAAFAPQAVTTENHISQIGTDALVLAPFAPQATVAANNTSEIGTDALTLAPFDPQAVTTEKHIGQIGTDALTLAPFAPQAIVSDNNVSELPAAAGGGTFSHQSSQTTTSAGSASASITHGLSIQAGDLVIAYVHANGASRTISDDGGGVAFTEEVNAAVSGETCRHAFYWKIAGASEPATYSWTLDGSDFWRVCFKVFRPTGGIPTVDLAANVVLTSGQQTSLLCEASDGRNISAGALSIICGGTDGRPAGVYDTADESYINVVGRGDNQATAMAHRIFASAETLNTVSITPTKGSDFTYSVHISFVLPGSGLALKAFAPDAVVSEGANNFTSLPSDVLSLAPFAPQAVTSEKHISQIGTDALVLAPFAPDAVTTEGAANFSDLPSIALTLVPFAPQVLATENRVSQIGTDALTLVPFAPQVLATENNVSQAGTVALTLAPFAPDAITTENNVSQAGTVALTLAPFAPQVLRTEDDVIELPLVALTLVPFAPNAITSEGASQFVDLPSVALTLTPFAPQAITVDAQLSQIGTDALVLVPFAPQVVTTENRVSQIGTDALILAPFAPQVVTFDPSVSQIGTDALSLAPFAPAAVTTENHTSQIGTQVLTLAGFASQSIATENNFALIGTDALTLAPFAPDAVVTEGEFVSLPSVALTLTPFAPQVIVTDLNISQIGTDALVLAPFAPQAITTGPQVSQIGTDALVLAPFAPQAVTTENNFSQIGTDTLVLAPFAPQAIATENRISQLPFVNLTLVAHEVTVTVPLLSQRVFIIT